MIMKFFGASSIINHTKIFIYLCYFVNFACEDYTQGRGFTQLQTIHNQWLLIKFLKVSIEVTIASMFCI